MNYLTADQVLFIHYRLISETGGDHGVIDLNGLLSSLWKAKASLADTQIPHSLFHSAAILLSSLVNASFFREGNLVTAIAVTELFLRINGYRLVVDPQELLKFVKQNQVGVLEIEATKIWLKTHSDRLEHK